ncbi:MAG: response regulator [Terracidiphilus sp.]
MSEAQTPASPRIPTVYFIDDSATMREVIKIAFRKENIHVVTCADAASALAQFAETKPDAVITDVIMPDKDGYEVCQFVRQHEKLSKVPVILMSGIVNQTVAEKAMKVKADELIRKPFQPQDLIARVKALIGARIPVSAPAVDSPSGPSSSAPRVPAQALSNLFSPGPSSAVSPSPASSSPKVAAISASRTETSVATLPPRPAPSMVLSPAPVASANNVPAPVAPAARAVAQPADVQKLRNENLRLELLVKRLQAELAAGREYCAALEAHFKRLQESD